jgi:hypothetical protein
MALPRIGVAKPLLKLLLLLMIVRPLELMSALRALWLLMKVNPDLAVGAIQSRRFAPHALVVTAPDQLKPFASVVHLL